MTVSVVEISGELLSVSALNLINDLRAKGIYINSIEKRARLVDFFSGIDEFAGQKIILHLSEIEYLNFTKKVQESASCENGAYRLHGTVIFPVVSDKNYHKYLENLLSYNENTSYTVYKLFDVSLNKIKLFFEHSGVKYFLDTDGLDVRVGFDISSFSVEERWEYLKSFHLEFNEYIYAETDISLAEQLVKILKLRNIKMSTAESFTAGGLSSYITSVSGASAVFYEGIVAYQEEAKQERLGVAKNTLLFKRPVSSQTAYEMCVGLLKKGVDICVSTTGLAGPDGDGSNLPVGLAFIGIGTVEKISVYKYKFSGSRRDITERGIKTAVFILIKALRDGNFNV